MVEGADDFYKDISELKSELGVFREKKDVSVKDLHEAVNKLAQVITGMLEVFGAAAEQLKLEEREMESDAKKHELIVAKLDKLIDQNRTIAEGMVAIVEMVKERLIAPAKEKGQMFKPPEEPMFKPEPSTFMKPEWPKPEMPRPQLTPAIQQPVASPDFGMPPLEPTPTDFDMEEPLPKDEEAKKKGLFGMFKK